MFDAVSSRSEDGHALALLGTTDVAAATSALPMVAAISLGFSISVLLDPEREAFDGHLLTACGTLSLTIACALAIYTITFSLLEFYYIHLTAGAACVEDARKQADRAGHANDGVAAPGQPQQPGSFGGTSKRSSDASGGGDHELTHKLLAAIDDFNSERARARQTMWYSLSALLVAVVCHITKDALNHGADDPLSLIVALATVGVLLVSMIMLWRTVYAFRDRYRAQLLGVHGYSW